MPPPSVKAALDSFIYEKTVNAAYFPNILEPAIGTKKSVTWLALFISMGERRSNTEFANVAGYCFLLPQERAIKFLLDLRLMVEDCFAQVRSSSLVIACLSGTCVEIGYAIALKKPVLGYRTDFRGSEIDGVNAMFRYGCKEFVYVPSFEFRTEDLAAELAHKVQNCIEINDSGISTAG
jgi:hypothetical protein